MLSPSDESGLRRSTGNLATLAQGPRWSRWGAVVAEANRIRGYGDFYHYHLLASGRIDAVVESDVNILDIGALSLIVEEAGGRFTDLDGGPVGLETPCWPPTACCTTRCWRGFEAPDLLGGRVRRASVLGQPGGRLPGAGVARGLADAGDRGRKQPV